MFEVTVESDFSAAHRLRDYEGACERLHGHNYRVQVSVRGRELLSSGMLLDFKHLKSALKRQIEVLDHRCINDDIEEFAPGGMNTTAENIAYWIGSRIGADLPEGVALARVKVWESDRSWATYTPD